MSAESLTIVIVGGVAGGASAATRARRMNENAEIIVFERDEHVSFANCGLPYYIGEEIAQREKLLVATPQFLERRFRLDVRVREEVLSIDRDRKSVEVQRASGETYHQGYDKLILAPGARPIVPPIDGVGAANVLTLRNLEDTDRIKSIVDSGSVKSAVVVGAGFIGLEMIEQLVERGIDTTLVELQPQVLPLLDPEMAKPLEKELVDKGVHVKLGIGISSIDLNDAGDANAIELSDGTRLAADLVILGIGVRPNTELASAAGLEIGSGGGIATNEFMQTDDPAIYAVGDAAEYLYGPTSKKMRIALAGPANRAGRLAGEHAATGNSAKVDAVMGTSIVRLFDMSAGMTGLTRGLAERMGIAAQSVTIVANHHAGYFPGAQPVTLKLVYAPDTGLILGAQAVGRAGVDKRIDVVATAMHFKGTVRDLGGLDLAYAPPFGAAKDPIHLAAFAAGNQLDGFESFVDSDDDLSGIQIVDVRTSGEVERSPLASAAGAINIPVDELRDRLGELDPKKPTVVSCGVGVRGHIASRILRQHGFKDVSNLSGGATVRNRML